jgi:hypothetical protein
MNLPPICGHINREQDDEPVDLQYHTFSEFQRKFCRKLGKVCRCSLEPIHQIMFQAVFPPPNIPKIPEVPKDMLHIYF